MNIDELLDEVMMYQALMGKKAKVRMTNAFYQKMISSEVEASSTGNISGILCEIDDSVQDYIIEFKEDMEVI